MQSCPAHLCAAVAGAAGRLGRDARRPVQHLATVVDARRRRRQLSAHRAPVQAHLESRATQQHAAKRAAAADSPARACIPRACDRSGTLQAISSSHPKHAARGQPACCRKRLQALRPVLLAARRREAAGAEAAAGVQQRPGHATRGRVRVALVQQQLLAQLVLQQLLPPVRQLQVLDQRQAPDEGVQGAGKGGQVQAQAVALDQVAASLVEQLGGVGVEGGQRFLRQGLR